MPTAVPKFRDDLVVSEQEVGGETCFVIKDPETGRFFRWGEAEHFFASQLDGNTSLTEVRSRVAQKFGVTNGLESLQSFIEQLRRAGLLEEARPPSDRNTALPPRVRGSVLYLRLKAFDPNRLLDELARRLSFVFTSGFVLLSAMTILFALGVVIANWDEARLDLIRLYSPQGVLIAWFTALVVTALHEFAHGVTCKHFGHSVREMGFLLIYFQPAFYCNVSDAWLIPEKSKRLWVTFAGGYFELFLWALATLIWRVTEPTSSLSYVALVVLATSGIKTVLNLNPLLKLDGYYLLSDYLELPNLRQRAFAYLRGQMRRALGTATWVLTPETSRERAIYTAYGLLAGAFSFSLLGYLALKFGGFLVERYQGPGFLLFAVLVVAAVRPSLPKPLSEGTPALPKPQPGRRGALRRRALVLTFLGCVLALLLFGRMELTVSGPFEILPAHNTDVRAEVDGIIEEILLDEGDVVQAGAVVARLSARDHRAELEKIQAEMAAQRARLRMLKVGPRQEELDLATITVEKADKALHYARSRQVRVQALFNERLASEKEIEEAEEQATIREKELQEARGQLNVLLAGSRAEEIEATEAEISRLVAQRSYLEGQLSRVEVKTPIARVITTRKLREKVGQHVSKGDLIAEVHELSVVQAEIEVPEKEIADVRLRQRVVIKANAYPEQTFYGEVASIAPTASRDQEGYASRTIRVTTALDNSGLRLKPEMTGSAKIRCGERSILALASRRVSRLIRVEFWSWW